MAGLPVVALVRPGALGGDLHSPAAPVAASYGAGRAGADHGGLAGGLHHGALLVALARVVLAAGVDALAVQAGHQGGAVGVHAALFRNNSHMTSAIGVHQNQAYSV